MTFSLDKTPTSLTAALAGKGAKSIEPQGGAPGESGDVDIFAATLVETSPRQLVRTESGDDAPNPESAGVSALATGDAGRASAIVDLSQMMTGMTTARLSEKAEDATTEESSSIAAPAADGSAPPPTLQSFGAPPASPANSDHATSARIDATLAADSSPPATTPTPFELREPEATFEGGSSSKAPASDGDDAASEAPTPLRVTMIETHLPSAVAHAVTTMAASRDDPAPPTSIQIERPVSNPRESAPVKILKFELEPASLGALVVKMRMAQARVEIEIDVQSSAAMSHLHELREKLASAVAATGCAVDALDIRVAPSLSLDMGQTQTNDGRPSLSQGSNSQRQDFSDGDGSGERRHPQQREASKFAPRGERNRHNGAGGVFL